MLPPLPQPVDSLTTAEHITAARVRLMDWHAETQELYPGDELFDLVRERVAAAITARAIALRLETV